MAKRKTKVKKKKDAILVTAVTLVLFLGIFQFIYGADQNTGGLAASKRYCSDSDGGINPFAYGYLTFYKKTALKEFKDVCLSDLQLKEYYCSRGKPAYTKLNCEDGCLNGACINTMPPVPLDSPDFQPVGLEWKPDPIFEELYAKVKNNGAIFRGPLSVEIRIERNGAYFFEAGKSVPLTWDQGETKTYSFNDLLKEMPALIPGNYSIGVEVDPDDLITEKNENNNVFIRGFYIPQVSIE